MIKKTIFVLIAVVLIIIGLNYFEKPSVEKFSIDVRNATYLIDDNPVQLHDGVWIETIPDSVSVRKVWISDFVADGDLDHDGAKDKAVILIEDGGGSGRFYFVATLLNQGNAAVPIEAFPIGDRIKPISLSIESNSIKATIQERGEDDPMSTEPTIKKLLTFTIKENYLTLVPAP